MKNIYFLILFFFLVSSSSYSMQRLGIEHWPAVMIEALKETCLVPALTVRLIERFWITPRLNEWYRQSAFSCWSLPKDQQNTCFEEAFEAHQHWWVWTHFPGSALAYIYNLSFLHYLRAILPIDPQWLPEWLFILLASLGTGCFR